MADVVWFVFWCSFIKEGKIVPVEVTVKLLLAAMEKNPGKKFLIDGFPRSMDNKDGWYSVVGDKAEVAFCLFYDCPEEELEKRLLKRGETSGRDDDNIESIKKRFRTFKETSMPVVEWFGSRGMLRTVSSVQTVEEVWAATKRVFDELESGKKNPVPKPQVVFVLGGPGAGKGTQCANIVRDYGWVHLSAGDLLRAERETGSENAAMINRCC